MRILIISAEVWRANTNGGNVLSNLFEGMTADFAQIYCNPGLPDNRVCKTYFQMTDLMMIRNLLKRVPVGKRFHLDTYNDATEDIELVNAGYFQLLKRFRWQGLYLIRELLWFFAHWDNEQLKKFVLEFKPDIVFAPCYGSHYMLRLTRHIHKLTDVKFVSYISDDIYSLKQFSISPLFWLNRLILRKSLRKTFSVYSLVYTMTLEQLNEISLSLGADMKILRKGEMFDGVSRKAAVNSPIKITYAGSIYGGRFSTLNRLGKSLLRINSEGLKYVLNIYTQTTVTRKIRRCLHNGRDLFLNGQIDQEALKNIYALSDIALHVESFELKNKLLTRLSFSTKIVDCLASTCAVMAISWREQAGYKYLQKEDAAICIDSSNKIEPTLRKILDNSNVIIEYADKAWQCGKRNHQLEQIQAELYSDLKHLTCPQQ